MQLLKPLIFVFALFLILLPCEPSRAAIFCDAGEDQCWMARKGKGSTPSAVPTGDAKIKINPSAVPIEKGFGIEAIAYRGEFDFSIVRGLGRVGAAISPSNTEETFFGPPGFEHASKHAERKVEQTKYVGQKYTLATAFGLFNNKKRDLKRFEMNFGVMGKYNTETQAIHPGAGISGVLGPFTYGYSVYSDENQFVFSENTPEEKALIKYTVETYSGGIFLSSVALDYSVLRMLTTDVSTISVLTGTLFLSRFMFTVAQRIEDSSRAKFNFETRMLENVRQSQATFLGAQITLNRNLMLGAFYNYYTLEEISIGGTLFF